MDKPARASNPDAVPRFMPSISTPLLLVWICFCHVALTGTGWTRSNSGIGASTQAHSKLALTRTGRVLTTIHEAGQANDTTTNHYSGTKLLRTVDCRK